MADALLEYAPPQFDQVLQGLPVLDEAGNPDDSESVRMFAMANFIYAALDQHSRDWSDHTSASSPYLPVSHSSASSPTLDAPDAHLPSYIRAQIRSNAGMPDERIGIAIRNALPNTVDVFTRPSLRLPEMGVWSCADCHHIMDPFNLTLEDRVLLSSYLGVGQDCGITVSEEGRVQLERANPWQFMRSVDCLGWSHLASHLKDECVVLWFPNPNSTYKTAPGVWWDEERFRTRAAFTPVLLQLQGLEHTAQYDFRMWKSKKMMAIADKGLHAARYHLTRWRREAVRARESLVHQMFEAGHGIVETGLALVHLIDQEQTDSRRERFRRARDEYRALKAEWTRRKERWSRAYFKN